METKKVFKIPIIFGVIVFLFSFFYGGIYTEIFVEGLGFSIWNLFLNFLGSIIIGILYSIPVLVISYIYYRSKD